MTALKCGINAVGAQGCSCMSTFCHAPLKIALLLHKMANGPYSLSETVPLLKALMCGINTVGAQGCGCIFTFCHAYLKMGVLLHKMAIVCNQKFMAVCGAGLIQ